VGRMEDTLLLHFSLYKTRRQAVGASQSAEWWFS
jgi:hypothetical protein